MNAAFAIGRLCDFEAGCKRILSLKTSDSMVFLKNIINLYSVFLDIVSIFLGLKSFGIQIHRSINVCYPKILLPVNSLQTANFNSNSHSKTGNDLSSPCFLLSWV